jgi:hypothetical protein
MNKYTDLIVAELTRLGVRHEVRRIASGHGAPDDYITVDRTSMVNCAEGPRDDEQSAYNFVLARLKDVCGKDARVIWSGRTDDYLGVEVFDVSNRIR